MTFKLAIISAISLLIVATSCINNDPYPVTYPTMGTVTDITNYTINSDSYGIIIPKNPNIISAKDADSIGQRIFANIYFHKENEKENASAKEVDIFELFKVLTKNANDLRVDKSEDINNFGDNTIQIIPPETGSYISEEHLNLEFYINGENTKIPHRISLVLTEDTKLDDEGLLNVELKHNSYNDGESERFWGIASFTLSSIPECSDPKFTGFKISYKSFYNIKKELTILKPSNKKCTVRRMESSEEIDHRHALLSCELQ